MRHESTHEKLNDISIPVKNNSYFEFEQALCLIPLEIENKFIMRFRG